MCKKRRDRLPRRPCRGVVVNIRSCIPTRSFTVAKFRKIHRPPTLVPSRQSTSQADRSQPGSSSVDALTRILLGVCKGHQEPRTFPFDTGRNLYNDVVMEQIGYGYPQPNLDAVFAALADPTRRAILSRLAEGEASVNEIAAPFEISQPAVSRHLKVLERAGLVERDIDEQRRPARLKADNMAAAVDWLAEFRAFWEASFYQLDDVLLQMKHAETGNSEHE